MTLAADHCRRPRAWRQQCRASFPHLVVSRGAGRQDGRAPRPIGLQTAAAAGWAASYAVIGGPGIGVRRGRSKGYEPVAATPQRDGRPQERRASVSGAWTQWRKKGETPEPRGGK